MPRPELFLRMGSHAEKQYVVKTIKLFEGLLVGSNLLESTPGATVSLALSIMGKLKRQFVINPITYVFGMDLAYIQSETIERKGAGKGKRESRSQEVLRQTRPAIWADDQICVVDKQRPVRPGDFDDKGMGDLAEATHAYQTNRMRQIWESDPQFADFARDLSTPSFTFAPYFYTAYGESAAWGDWHKLNIGLAAKYSSLDHQGHAVVCIGPKILNSKQDALALTKDYIDTGITAFWLWFSTLSEEKITAEKLGVLVAIIELLRDANRKVYNLHGGFLSALLSKERDDWIFPRNRIWREQRCDSGDRCDGAHRELSFDPPTRQSPPFWNSSARLAL